MSFKKTRSSWIIALVLGMSLPILFWFTTVKNSPRAELIRNAEKSGVPPQEFADVTELLKKAEDKGDLNDADWKRLNQLFHSQTSSIRCEAISAMMDLGKSRRRGDALNMVRPVLNNGSPMEQSFALILLWRFHDPAWHDEAVRQSQSANIEVAKSAKDLLTRRQPK